MSDEAVKVIVLAGALTQAHWVPPAEITVRLARLATFTDLHGAEVALPPSAEALPRELAHDRWLRLQLDPQGMTIVPGALAAVRRVAPFSASLAGWLLEPVHFHLAQDHLVLLAGAAHDLTSGDAQQLADAIAPLLAHESFTLEVLDPDAWLLAPGDLPLQVDCASSEAAAGRNVEGYLPVGPHARRYRKLLNEVQMTWHEHPVNRRREACGQLPINSLWLSGPVVPAALAAFNEARREGRYEVDDTLLAARLRDDRFAWLDSLQSLDARLAESLASAQPPAVLLCGDHEVRWLQRAHRRSASLDGAAGGVTSLLRRLGALVGARRGPAAGPGKGRACGEHGLAALFTETAASA